MTWRIGEVPLCGVLQPDGLRSRESHLTCLCHLGDQGQKKLGAVGPGLCCSCNFFHTLPFSPSPADFFNLRHIDIFLSPIKNVII